MESQSQFKVDVVWEIQGIPETESSVWVIEDVEPVSLSVECPHCHVYSVMQLEASTKRTPGWGWHFDFVCTCPRCEHTVFLQAEYTPPDPEEPRYTHPWDAGPERTPALGEVVTIYPPTRPVPLPPQVPQEYRDDHYEAQSVLELSPKASAALSRRCLQRLLREYLRIKKHSLSQEIQELLESGDLPLHLADAVDAVRNIGNFAAHPLKDTNTGEIIEVEPGEAEWTLEVLESLLDFYFGNTLVL